MMIEWQNEYYRELDAAKRQAILEKHRGECTQADALMIGELWQARYGKRKPKNDAFVGALMELKYIAESNAMFGTKGRKDDAAKLVSKLFLFEADRRTKREQEIILAELKNTFLKLIEVSRLGRGFNSVIFGMGQLSDEGVAKKVAEQISAIAFAAPHKLHMDKEFAMLQKAALLAFRQEYPNREHLLTKC